MISPRVNLVLVKNPADEREVIARLRKEGDVIINKEIAMVVVVIAVRSQADVIHGTSVAINVKVGVMTVATIAVMTEEVAAGMTAGMTGLQWLQRLRVSRDELCRLKKGWTCIGEVILYMTAVFSSMVALVRSGFKILVFIPVITKSCVATTA